MPSLARLAASALLFGFTIAACGKSDDDPGGATNGVNDLAQSCAIRATWAHAAAQTCIDCVTSAPSPSCDCAEFKDFAGKCLTQAEAKQADASCTSAIDTCARACTDCDCYASCYAAAPSCKAASAAREGCVTQVCDPYCK